MKVRVAEGSQLPTKGHETDAGWDLYSPCEVRIASLDFSDRIDLGVGFEIPKGHVGLVKERSSQGKKGIFSVGQVVDHGYTGNVHVTLVNNSSEEVIYKVGDRIAQLIVVPVLMDALEEVDELDGSERGDAAHGSTGV